jgi:hypothetical protein
MYPSHLGPGDRLDLVEPPADGPILGYSHESVASLYAYARNNPTNFLDATGLQEWYAGPEIPLPTPPDFPKAGQQGPSRDNIKTAFGFNICLCTPNKKSARLKPIPGIGKPAMKPRTVGAIGGTHSWYGWPAIGVVGTGGCAGCIALIVKCKSGVAVYHFTAGDEPGDSLGLALGGGTYDWSACTAIVCGGDDTRESNCLADYVLRAAKDAGISVVGVSGAFGCGVNPDGTWYQL